MIICDEAHRTTGYGKDATAFTAVHQNNFVAAKKRMYMTATPRLYTSDAKKKAVAFCSKIAASKDVAKIFNELQKNGFNVETKHIAETFSSAKRNDKK